MLDCNSTLDLVPALLLDVLDAAEIRAVREHLAACEKCRAEADALRPVANSIGLAAPDRGEPAPRVKQQLLAKIDARPKPIKEARRWFFRPIAILAPAALSLALVIILGTWALTNQTQLQQQQTRLDRLSRQQIALRDFMLDPSIQPVSVQVNSTAAANVAVYASHQAFAMAVTGLKPLQGEEVYQCWWYDGDAKPVAGDVFRVDTNGAGVWAWNRPAGQYTLMKVTKEPRQGQTQPTGDVLFTANVPE